MTILFIIKNLLKHPRTFSRDLFDLWMSIRQNRQDQQDRHNISIGKCYLVKDSTLREKCWEEWLAEIDPSEVMRVLRQPSSNAKRTGAVTKILNSKK